MCTLSKLQPIQRSGSDEAKYCCSVDCWDIGSGDRRGGRPLIPAGVGGRRVYIGTSKFCGETKWWVEILKTKGNNGSSPHGQSHIITVSQSVS
jgi:hypothetical protein